MQFGIGQPVPRTEDPRLLRGGGQYIDDVTLPGQTYAAMVRAPVAHAIITRIDTQAAALAHGVLAVLTGADYVADGLGEIVGNWSGRRRDGSPTYRPPRPAITHGWLNGNKAGKIVVLCS